MPDRLVIVGASLAGMRAAQAARRAGHEGSLIVIGDEPHQPYTRPPLSKELLAGDHQPDQTALPGHDKIDADWRLGVAATGLDRERKVVRLDDGDEVEYERLIVATGTRARPWPGGGGELGGVHLLRSIDDALALRSALDSSPERLVIVGAGFIGCEVAATARKKGIEVTMLDIAAHPMVPLGPMLGEHWSELHGGRGVDLRCATAVKGLTGDNGHVTGAELENGETIAAPLVVVALGALPNTEWLTGSGIELDPGVVCDPALTSVSDSDVLAAGDVVSWPHPLADGERIRIEHWTTAAEQGQLAGRNALLDPADRESHVAPPYFWSDQYEFKIQAAGLPARASRLELLERDGDRLVAAGERDGRLIAVVGIGAAKRVAWYRRQLTDGAKWDEVVAAVKADDGSLGPVTDS